MTEKLDYDLIVLGAGPGGYVAAIRASQLGLRTAVVERDKPGGVCLNVGCIPSKALIEQARIFTERAALSEMGVAVDASRLDYRKVFARSRAAAGQLSKGVRSLLTKNRVDYVEGTAKLETPRAVAVDGRRTITARHVLVATGSRPAAIPGFELDEQRVLSSTGALLLEELPRRLVILGAGAIGVELAYVFRAFGVDVTLVELMDRILPQEDPEASRLVSRSFARDGVRIRTSTRALSCDRHGVVLKIALEGKDGAKETVDADKVLVAVGRVPNSDGLGLEAIGVRTEKGYVQVGDHYQTAVPGVYAVGDVVGAPLLAHVASKEAEIAVEHMAGRPAVARLDPELVPFATYCEPQVASFGKTEPMLVKAGAPFEKAVFPYRAIGKAVAVGKSEGFVKLLLDPGTREILGCTIAGAEATELVHQVLLAKKAELTVEEIATMVHAHPSLAEGVMEAARVAEGWAIHL